MKFQKLSIVPQKKSKLSQPFLSFYRAPLLKGHGDSNVNTPLLVSAASAARATRLRSETSVVNLHLNEFV